jgi:DNA (cytosine-5)-methyltransferase 3A
MKILSLFDGISCARVAIEKAGIEIEKYYASEIDKYAISIAQKNFPDTIQVGSVVDLKGEDFKDIDILIGGSPCQDLSIAKKNREGLNGARSGLFYEYVRILKEVKPKYFILENVNSMPKEAKETITKELFGIEPIMINAALVSAQNRKRLFWIGKLVGDKYEQVKMELPEDEGILLKDILEEEVDEKYYVKLSDRFPQKNIGNGIGYNPYSDSPVNEKARALNTGCGGATTKNATTIRVGQLNQGGQGDRIYSPDGKSVNLSANGVGRGARTGIYAVSQRGRNIVDGKRKDIKGARTEQRIEVEKEQKAHCITKVQKDSMIMENYKIRKLTPIECERLQSLPDGFTEKGLNENNEEVLISNTQRYKALGNGFNCKVIEHIIKNL